MVSFRRLSAGSAVLPLCALALAPSAPIRAQATIEWMTLSIMTSEKDLALTREILPDQTVMTHVKLRTAEPARSPSEAGLPDLPFFTRHVALPLGAKVERIAATPGQVLTFQGARLVSWVQPDRPGRDPVPPTFAREREGLIYHAAPDGVALDPRLLQVPVWPGELVEVVETSEAAGYQLLKLNLFPVHWRPREGVIDLVTQVEVKVAFSGGRTPKPTRRYGQTMAFEELRAQVSNPDFIADGLIAVIPEELDAWYLIITDNFQWSPNLTKGAALAGDLVAEFQRLADWKTAKGVKAAVVTVTDIVGNRYGNFKAGARDLQEVIRNFLKHAREDWNTYWVLLGGDIEVIPPREVVAHTGHSSHYLKREDAAQPEENKSYWHDASDTVRIHHDGYIDPTEIICSRQTGRAFARVAAPSGATPGWAYATSDSYAAISAAKTDYIILRGPLADTELKDFYAAIYKNTIPTDLYFASLEGPDYGLPGLHDWDKNDNGLYGQYFEEASLDGVDYKADLALGRAPVSSGAEAQAFVNKVLAYEAYDDLPLNFGRKLLLGSANWSGGPAAVSSPDNPPDAEEYYSAAGSTTAKLHFEGPPASDRVWKLVAWNGPGDWWVVPYDRNAGPASLGYYYCTSASYAVRSELVFDFWAIHFEIPIPTAFVKVLGPAADLHPDKYFFDNEDPDLSVVEKELLKDQFTDDVPELNLRKRLYQDFADTPGYPDPDLFELSQAAMQDALNSGYNIVSLTGHGNWGGCCAVSSSYVDDLTNGYKGGVVYADSCSTCEFNHDDAVCEVFLKTATGGASGYVGNSRYSWVGPGAPLERAFWHQLTLDRHLGRLHNSKGALADSNAHRWACFSLNLMGDPEMPLWIGSPKALEVTHPASVVQGNSFIVKVKSSGAPLSFARVCLTGPRGIFELHYTGVTGETEFFTADKEIGDELVVTVTKEDYLPYQGTVDVTGRFRGFIRADANQDSRIDLSDAVAIFASLFLGAGKLACPDAADANDDGLLDLSDGVKVLNFLYLGDRLPPGTIPGQRQEDPTPDGLSCS